MPHKFRENQKVALKGSLAELKPGTIGTVWCLYHGLNPPAYEVTFPSEKGDFDALMEEDELLEPTATEAEDMQSALA